MSVQKKTPDQPTPARKMSFLLDIGMRFFMLFGLWVLLSGMLDAFHLALGALSSAFIILISYSFFPKELILWRRPSCIWSIFIFILWLLVEIIKANAAMLRLVFRKDITAHMEPDIVNLQTRLRNPMALTVFANSITLTPGTISVTVNGKGEFSVHTIDSKSAENLPGEMERKIGRIFGE
ncbi:Na+/H+ antiporter subunit E [Pseudodesulfovibrio senegalensis]|nr:Na+/H+ antiporter subunit E [Pseudodesulfovibrio senegalensis]